MSGVLIVGCGYLGRRVARLLRDQGLQVWGTTRTVEGARRVEAAGIEPIVLDVVDPTAFDRLPPADRVLWCVGFAPHSGRSIREVYVDGPRNLVSRLPGPGGRLVYTSSTGVYGQDDGGWVGEDAATIPRTESGRACLEAEAIVREHGASSGWNVTVLRLAGLYGPGRLIRRGLVERGEPIPGDPEHWLNLIHVDDAARVVAWALGVDTPDGIYNVTDGCPVRRREFYGSLARVIGAGEPRFEAHSGSSKGRDATNKRVSNRRLRSVSGAELIYPDWEKGLRASVGTCT